MKTHYLYSPTYPITPCGLYVQSNFMRTTISHPWLERTTWRATCNSNEVTCGTCLRCMQGYKRKIQAIIDRYADTPVGKLVALLLDNYSLDEDGYYYGGPNAQELHTALAFRLMGAGLIGSLQELDIEYWR